jgi:hypothetical protein
MMGNDPPAEQRLAKYVTVNHFVHLTGYSSKAIYCKIAEGHWIEGQQYRRAPDGRLMIMPEGVERWVEGNRSLPTRR